MRTLEVSVVQILYRLHFLYQAHEYRVAFCILFYYCFFFSHIIAAEKMKSAAKADPNLGKTDKTTDNEYDSEENQENITPDEKNAR